MYTTVWPQEGNGDDGNLSSILEASPSRREMVKCKELHKQGLTKRKRGKSKPKFHRKAKSRNTDMHASPLVRVSELSMKPTDTHSTAINHNLVEITCPTTCWAKVFLSILFLWLNTFQFTGLSM